MSLLRADKHIYRYVDTNGNGTGTKSAVGNYAIAAEEFYFEASFDTLVYRMIIGISDTAGMQAQEYGNLGAALTNGVEVEVRDSDDTVLLDLLDGLPVKTNAEWGRVNFDVSLKTWGAGNELITSRWTFEKAGQPLWLKPGDKFVVRLNDDMTGLLSHTFFLNGYRIDP